MADIAVKKNPQLWERAKKQAVAKMGGKWSARAAQYATKLYKGMGGKYVGKRAPGNRLMKWTREDWGYVDGKRGNRYLPRKVRASLTSDQKRRTNAAKRRDTRRGVQWSRQPRDVARVTSRLRRRS